MPENAGQLNPPGTPGQRPYSRILTGEARSEATAEREGGTPQGRRFWREAQDAERSGNLELAVQKVKMALTFERGNERFTAKLAELEAAKPKKKKNPFAIQ